MTGAERAAARFKAERDHIVGERLAYRNETEAEIMLWAEEGRDIIADSMTAIEKDVARSLDNEGRIAILKVGGCWMFAKMDVEAVERARVYETEALF